MTASTRPNDRDAPTPGAPLQTADLVLRAFADDDASAFAVAARESADDVGRWMPWCPAAYTESDARDGFAQTHAERSIGSSFEQAVLDARTQVLLGGAGRNLINRQHGIVDLGDRVRQSARRRGVASQAAAALVDHAFRAIGLQRVEIVVAVGNEASAAVARHIGAVLEGVARQRLRIGDRPVDASVFRSSTREPSRAIRFPNRGAALR